MAALIQIQTAAAVQATAHQAAATTPPKQPKTPPFPKLKDQDLNHYHAKGWILILNQMTKVNKANKKEVGYHRSHLIEKLISVCN